MADEEVLLELLHDWLACDLVVIPTNENFATILAYDTRVAEQDVWCYQPLVVPNLRKQIVRQRF